MLARLSWLTSFALTLSLSFSSHSQRNVQPATGLKQVMGVGALSGKVFAITRAGDLKPGRFAEVNVFFTADSSDTPYRVFLNKHREIVASRDEKLAKTYAWARDSSDKDAARWACKLDMLAVDEAILATLEWLKQTDRLRMRLSTNTDEEGQFILKDVPEGHYFILVRGRSGANDAFWKQEITILSGEAAVVKVNSVELACLSL